jgi:hypothetical protein
MFKIIHLRPYVFSSSLKFPSALGLLFIGLKLTRYIDWSWWWVTCPFWAVPALLLGLGAALLIAGGLIYLCAEILDRILRWRKRRRSARDNDYGKLENPDSPL